MLHLQRIQSPDKLLGYDFEGKRFKIFRIFPGIVTLFFLILPLITVLTRTYPFMIRILLLVVIYWLYRGILVLYGLVVAFVRYQISKRIDWKYHLLRILNKEQWKKLPTLNELPKTPEEFFTVVLIPVYKEPYELLKETVEALKDSYFPKEKLIVVFAVEERGGEEIRKTVKRLQQEYKRYFADFRYYVHPEGIKGEAIGIAGPNLRWAAASFYNDIVSEGKDPRGYFIVKFDSDFKVTPKFLANLTYKFLTTPNRTRKYFTTAILLYSNNIWRVPPLTRVFSILLSFVHMAEWVTFKHWKESFSMYALSLKTLKDVHFWDPKIGVDDTGIYYQAFIRYHGDFYGEEIYIPGTMDALEGKTFFELVRNFYKQQVRWGGGAIVVPMFLTTLPRLKLSLLKKLDRLFHFFEIYTAWKIFSLYFLFYFPFISLFFESIFYQTSSFLLAYYLGVVFQISRTIAPLILMIILWLYREYAEKDRYPFLVRWLFLIIEFTVVFPINTVLFTFIPYLKAEIDIMRGKFGKFAVMPKYRR